MLKSENLKNNVGPQKRYVFNFYGLTLSEKAEVTMFLLLVDQICKYSFTISYINFYVNYHSDQFIEH